MEDDDEQVKRRAREIWEEEGRPEGREYSHWLRAKLDVRNMKDNDRDREAPAPAGKGASTKTPLDERDIDTQLDDPL
jgi:hypothetical protein